MGIVQEEVLFSDVVGIFDADLTWEFGKHPDSFAFAQSSGCMVAETSVGYDRVQEAETLVVLNGLVRVAYDSQDVIGVGADDCFSLGYVDPPLGL